MEWSNEHWTMNVEHWASCIVINWMVYQTKFKFRHDYTYRIRATVQWQIFKHISFYVFVFCVLSYHHLSIIFAKTKLACNRVFLVSAFIVATYFCQIKQIFSIHFSGINRRDGDEKRKKTTRATKKRRKNKRYAEREKEREKYRPGSEVKKS